MRFAAPGAVQIHGLLGEALAANHRGRLSTFIIDETSPAIALFDAAAVAANEGGDWYGEHAGKWLVAATRAAERTGDSKLLDNARRVADWLVARQDVDGYLGNYPPGRRFMVRQPPKPFSWDGAPAVRTWDIWTHAYLILGLLEAHRSIGEDRYLEAAGRIGDLVGRTLGERGIAITDLGNHFGLSATIMLDAMVELHFATGDQRHLDLALLILEQAERDPRSAFLSAALAGADPSEIATGKAYQLLWNLVGLAKLHLATGEEKYLEAVRLLWRKVRDHHLTLGGGPWGGVAHRSREVFNPGNVFDPGGYVETCSTMAWIQLNRILLGISGEAQFAEEIERSAFNDLIGAQAPDGEDWCYYSFANGRRTHTTYWRCCKSSGAMALEELPRTAYGLTADGAIAINILGPSAAQLELPQAGLVRIRQQGDYPFGGTIEVLVDPDGAADFTVDIRIPDWAQGAGIAIAGEAAVAAEPGRYASLSRRWSAGDRLVLALPARPVVHRASDRNVQESLAPDGARVAQEVKRHDYVALTRGAFVYATRLVDGFRTSETLPGLPDVVDDIVEIAPCTGEPGLDLELRAAGRAPLRFEPYYRAGGRDHGAWRLTWLGLAPARGEPS